MIYTSYFSKYKGSRGVSVAVKTPSWSTCCEKCPELMPDWDKVLAYKNDEITWKDFRRAYIHKLKKLDVEKIQSKLDGKVLLCWEATGKKCHRHIIREWLIRSGYECEEIGDME